MNSFIEHSDITEKFEKLSTGTLEQKIKAKKVKIHRTTSTNEKLDSLAEMIYLVTLRLLK